MRTLWILLMTVLNTTPAMGDEYDNVLVFGGTGRLGAPIVHLLIDAGYPVTVLARETSDRSRLDGLDVAWMTGDLTDAGGVVTAVDGRPFGIVIDASARGANREPYYAAAMRSMLAGIADSGVRQFILHGSVGAGDNKAQFPEVDFERMRDVMRAKGEAETLLKASGINYTIIRNGMIRPDGTPATGTARLTDDVALMGVVTRLDLAALTLDCVENVACMNKTFHAVD